MALSLSPTLHPPHVAALDTVVAAPRHAEGAGPTSNVWYVQDLVRRANEQDRPAFAELYERYSPRIYSYLYHRLRGSSHEAEDLTADVFAKVFEKLNTYQFRGLPFSAWVFRIAHNQLIDHVRGQPRRPIVPIELAEELEASGGYDQGLAAVQLREAMQHLTEEQRQVVAFRFLEGMSLAQTSAAVGKSEEAVKKLQARGLASLKRVMDCRSGCWRIEPN